MEVWQPELQTVNVFLSSHFCRFLALGLAFFTKGL